MVTGGVLLVVGAVAAVLYFTLGKSLRGEPTIRSFSLVRAERRAYDGAPPVIPHKPLGGSCTTCHNSTAREVPSVGIAPPNPHRHTPGLSDSANCRQCHVFQTRTDTWVASDFQPFPQDLRRGDRLFAQAPPVLPHRVFMREDCAACHTGEASRPEIRCTHSERLNCVQCHVQKVALP
jgi:cytochrome c-type protein NapB